MSNAADFRVNSCWDTHITPQIFRLQLDKSLGSKTGNSKLMFPDPIKTTPDVIMTINDYMYDYMKVALIPLFPSAQALFVSALAGRVGCVVIRITKHIFG